MPIPAEHRSLPSEPREQQRIAYSTCYMCACRCGIKLTLEGNQVRFIQGNRDHPVNQGVLCAKGSAGIMKQLSPAKLRKPLRRKPGTERGTWAFDEIEWDEALAMLTERLKTIRSTDPKKLAFFTGRDQMQALTGLWAQQFGTPNWAAHGGFCSVNMAAAGLYTIGYSFWEFARRTGTARSTSCCGAWPRTTRAIRSRSASTSSSATVPSSSRSIRCAPAIRRSPMNGASELPLEFRLPRVFG